MQQPSQPVDMTVQSCEVGQVLEEKSPWRRCSRSLFLFPGSFWMRARLVCGGDASQDTHKIDSLRAHVY